MLPGFIIPRSLDVLTLGLGLTSLFIHVVGTAFPYWWVVHELDERSHDWTFYYGIWEIVNCRDGQCQYNSSNMRGERAWLIGPATLLAMAAFLLLSAFLCLCTHFRRNVDAVMFRKIAFISSAGSASVIIISVLIFYKNKAGLRPSFAPETSSGNPGWALYLSTLGATVAIINCIVLTICMGRYSHKNLEKRKSVFGICARELEIDVNALRRGELIQGKDINNISLQEPVVMSPSELSMRKYSQQYDMSSIKPPQSFRKVKSAGSLKSY